MSSGRARARDPRTGATAPCRAAATGSRRIGGGEVRRGAAGWGDLLAGEGHGREMGGVGAEG